MKYIIFVPLKVLCWWTPTHVWGQLFGPEVEKGPPRIISNPKLGEEWSGDEIRVLSLNTFLVPINLDTVRRSRRIVEWLVHLDYDIIMLQEVFTNLDTFLDGLSPHYHIVSGIGRARPPMVSSGLLICSKLPMRNPQFFPVPLMGSDVCSNKGICQVEILVKDRSYMFYNLHLQSNMSLTDPYVFCEYAKQGFDWKKAMKVQTELQKENLAVLKRVVSAVPDDVPIMVVGDFNIFANSSEDTNLPSELFPFVQSAMPTLRDVYRSLNDDLGFSCKSERLDFMWASKHVNTVSCELIDSRDLSDHKGLTTVIKVE